MPSTHPAHNLLKLIRNLPGAGHAQCIEACKGIPLLAHEAGADEALALQACKALHAVVCCTGGDDVRNPLMGEAISALWDLETNLLRKLNAPERSHSKHHWL